MAPSQQKATSSEAEPTFSAADDISMTDETPAAYAEEAQQEHEDFDPSLLAMGEQRIRLLPGSTVTAASFEFKKEDHTLGNALRYIIMKNPDVEFCGYSIPHPSEPLMNIRIQTWSIIRANDRLSKADLVVEGAATEALEKGFKDLMDLCDVVTDKFEAARTEYHDKDRMEI